MAFLDRYALPQQYEHLINQIVSFCPAPDKFAHMTAGLLFWLLAAVVLRKPLYSRGPVAVVVLLEVANEYVDYLANHSWRWPDTLGDAAATWFWPFLLSFCMARMPRLRGGKR
jgi:hypothetical protein